MKLNGDAEGIVALKAMHQKNAGFMKALLDDARSTTDHTTYFRDDEGRRRTLHLDPASGDLTVQEGAPPSRPSGP